MYSYSVNNALLFLETFKRSSRCKTDIWLHCVASVREWIGTIEKKFGPGPSPGPEERIILVPVPEKTIF